MAVLKLRVLANTPTEWKAQFQAFKFYTLHLISPYHPSWKPLKADGAPAPAIDAVECVGAELVGQAGLVFPLQDSLKSMTGLRLEACEWYDDPDEVKAQQRLARERNGPPIVKPTDRVRPSADFNAMPIADSLRQSARHRNDRFDN